MTHIDAKVGEKMPNDIDRARERVEHQVAACIHAMLAHTEMTASELKAQVIAIPNRSNADGKLIDALLAGAGGDATATLLADIAYVLGFHWDFSVKRKPAADAVEAGATP